MKPWSSAPGEKPQGYVLAPNADLATVPATPPVESSKVYTLAELIDMGRIQQSGDADRLERRAARRASRPASPRAPICRNSPRALSGGYQASSGHDTAPGVPVLGSGSASGTVAAVSLQWLLFDFGERSAVVDMAKQAAVISDIAFTAAHQQVIYAVTRLSTPSRRRRPARRLRSSP